MDVRILECSTGIRSHRRARMQLGVEVSIESQIVEHGESRIERVAKVYPLIERPENAEWKLQYEAQLNSEDTFPMLVKGMNDPEIAGATY